MESPTSPRRAKRRQTAPPPISPTKAVAVAEEVYARLAGVTQKMKRTKSEYASAAIAYFLDNGLDPQALTSLTEGVKTRHEISETGYENRKMVAEVGNRLVSILKSFERELFKVLEAQQGGIFEYLGQIEANILNHQVGVEAQILTPLLERLIATGVETHMSRVLVEVLMLKTRNLEYTLEEARTTRLAYDRERDQQIVAETRKILETARVTRPQGTVKPPLAKPTPPPPKAAVKPAPPTPPATPTL